MGATTEIAWTDSTLNPWWGCYEVSPGCVHCYARMLSERWKRADWGKEIPRLPASEKVWVTAQRAFDASANLGRRHRVFVMSMGDICEVHAVPEHRAVLSDGRARLVDMVRDPRNAHIDWQLLTKRPEMYAELFPALCPLPNVWWGASMENAVLAETRMRWLRALDVAGPRWASYEPALGPVPWVDHFASGLEWVVVGGESGSKRRPFDIEWARDLIAVGRAFNVAVFVKQDSALHPGQQGRFSDAEFATKQFPREARHGQA